MIDQADAATIKWLLGIGGTLFGWIALRIENFGHRLVRVETKLDNGLAADVAEVKKVGKELSKQIVDLQRDLDRHVEGEEARILAAAGRRHART